MSPLVRCILPAASLLLAAAACPAEPVVDLKFDDPAGMLKATPLPLRQGDVSIASGTGGRAVPEMPTAATLQARGEALPAFVKIDEPVPGLRLEFTEASPLPELGLAIHPTELPASMGEVPFQGALDFFVRINTSEQAPRFAFWAWMDPLTMMTQLDNREGSGLLTRVSARDAILRDHEGGVPVKLLASSGREIIPFSFGQVMHVGAVFASEGEDVVISIYLQEGAGAMEIAPANLNAQVGPFQLTSKDVAGRGAPRFSFKLTNDQIPRSLDIYRFRLFQTPPNAFPALE